MTNSNIPQDNEIGILMYSISRGTEKLILICLSWKRSFFQRVTIPYIV